MYFYLDGPFASLFASREHKWWLTELEVWSSTLAVSKHGSVESDRHEFSARARECARVLLDLSITSEAN